MAAPKVIKRDPFKRGDTANFRYVFSQPYDGFDWTTVTIDCSLTSETAPANNSGAAVSRTAQSLTVDATDNSASYNFQLTIAESQALTAGTKYKDECQLKQSGTYVTTPITGETLVVQDYVI